MEALLIHYRKSVTSLNIEGEDVPAKSCSRCGVVKPFSAYRKQSGSVGGVRPDCKECRKPLDREYYLKNKERHREQSKAYREKDPLRWRLYSLNHYQQNKEYKKEYTYRWRKKYPEKYRAIKLRRRARERSLPDNLTDKDIDVILKRFSGKCALSGKSSDIQLDHFIPLASGYGGTLIQNMIPLSASINQSKSDSNPFIWFSENRERLGLDEDRFDDTIRYLSKLNGMDPTEYEAHVFNCCEYKEVVNIGD